MGRLLTATHYVVGAAAFLVVGTAIAVGAGVVLVVRLPGRLLCAAGVHRRPPWLVRTVYSIGWECHRKGCHQVVFVGRRRSWWGRR